jgi:hypothetical protein
MVGTDDRGERVRGIRVDDLDLGEGPIEEQMAPFGDLFLAQVDLVENIHRSLREVMLQTRRSTAMSSRSRPGRDARSFMARIVRADPTPMVTPGRSMRASVSIVVGGSASFIRLFSQPGRSPISFAT